MTWKPFANIVRSTFGWVTLASFTYLVWIVVATDSVGRSSAAWTTFLVDGSHLVPILMSGTILAGALVHGLVLIARGAWSRVGTRHGRPTKIVAFALLATATLPVASPLLQPATGALRDVAGIEVPSLALVAQNRCTSADPCVSPRPVPAWIIWAARGIAAGVSAAIGVDIWQEVKHHAGACWEWALRSVLSAHSASSAAISCFADIVAEHWGR